MAVFEAIKSYSAITRNLKKQPVLDRELVQLIYCIFLLIEISNALKAVRIEGLTGTLR